VTQTDIPQQPDRAEQNDQQLTAATPTGPRNRPWRRRIVSTLVIVAVAGGAFFLWWNGMIPAHGGDTRPSGATSAPAQPVATATVRSETLTAKTDVDATLGYAGDYQVSNLSRAGTVTWLPKAGDVITQGHPLYRVDDQPIPLLYGILPAYRNLGPGATGTDVSELNTALDQLGYDDHGRLDPHSNHYGTATEDAVKSWQDHLDVQQTGRLALGSFVFLPTQARVTSLGVNVGQPVGRSPVLTATSTDHQVAVALDVSLQAQVQPGDNVTITLPDGSTTTGQVTDVGTVASASSSSGDSSSSGSSSGTDSGATIRVLITPKDTDKLGRLDQAPVQVSIVTDTARNALVVPLAPLLARPGGSYAVQVLDGTNKDLVSVHMGLVDDADGLVAVTGAGLKSGQQVVVPQS